jgi:hypothetical protein
VREEESFEMKSSINFILQVGLGGSVPLRLFSGVEGLVTPSLNHKGRFKKKQRDISFQKLWRRPLNKEM